MNKFKDKYRYSLILLRQLVITDFKLRYQGSTLGYLWSLLRPLFLFIILYLVFDKFLKIGNVVPHYPVYLLLGIVLWNYFLEVTSVGITSIVGRGDLLRKLNFPKYVIVLSGSISAMINLVINFSVIAVFMLINEVEVRWTIVAMPLIIAELFIFSLGCAFLLSALFVKIRDLNYIWEVLMQALFYATPILYPLTLVISVSPFFAKLLLLNPMAQIIQDARYILVTDQTITFEQLFNSGWYRLIPIAIVIVTAIFGAWYFRKQSPNFAEEL